jgi:hypothetical protein
VEGVRFAVEPAHSTLKNWRVLRKIRSSPNTADKLIAAVQPLMIASARSGWQRLIDDPEVERDLRNLDQ